MQGRVCLSHRGSYLVWTNQGEIQARLSGKFLYQALSPADWPVTGDHVQLDPAGRIEAVLPRKSKLSRKRAGDEAEEQVLAANMDLLFLVAGLDHDFNPRRIERYLVAAAESGAAPVIVLNKADLCGNTQPALDAARAVAGSAPVVAVSAATGEGFDSLVAQVRPGETAALAGSSGVGKSSILNRLLGHAQQAVQPVRAHDGRGRHTTTRRELVAMPGGWFLMDLPGLRELQLWVEPDRVEHTFADVAALAAGCRFRDCSHQDEPGCAVRRAVQDGRLSAERWQNYEKLNHEVDRLEKRRRERRISRLIRQFERF